MTRRGTDDANVTDIDLIDVEEDNLINSDDTIADPDEDDDAVIFSIANGYASEDDLLAVRTKRTATNKVMQQKNFCWHEK